MFVQRTTPNVYSEEKSQKNIQRKTHNIIKRRTLKMFLQRKTIRGAVQPPLPLLPADVICEQPVTNVYLNKNS